MRKEILSSLYWTIFLAPVLAAFGLFIANPHGSIGGYFTLIGMAILLPTFYIFGTLGTAIHAALLYTAIVVAQTIYWFSAVFLVRLFLRVVGLRPSRV